MTLLRFKRVVTVYLLVAWWARSDRAVNRAYFHLQQERRDLNPYPYRA